MRSLKRLHCSSFDWLFLEPDTGASVTQAVLVVLVAHAPPERRLFALNDVAVYPHRREDGTPDIVLALTTLAKSSASSCADNLEQVLKLVPQLGDAAVAAGVSAEALAGSVCFPGLLAPGRLAAAADAASDAYIDASREAGEEIDQRLFLREPGSGTGAAGGSTAALDPRQLTPRRQANSGGGSALPPHGRATPAPMRNISSLLSTPMRPTAAAAAAATTPSAQLTGMRSPAGGAASRSPISRMFVSAQWLRQLTTLFVPSEIDPLLMRYLAATGDDPAVFYNALLEQAQGYAQRVFPSPPPPQAVVPLALAAAGRGNHVTPTKFGSVVGAGAPERANPIEELAANAAVLAANQAAAAQSRRAQALALHFRMMARVLAIEEQKLTGADHPPGAPVLVPGATLAPGSPALPATPAPNFGQFLRGERIMRTLFSICADCVADAMHVVSWQFPAFQQVLQVLPFEAVSVVHLVAECDRELPYELKRTLGNMMDQLLDRLIWERGSGFYMHLLREKGGAPMPSTEDVPPAGAGAGAASGGGAASAGGAATGGSAATGVSATAAAGERTLLPLRFCTVAECTQPVTMRSHCCKALHLVHRLLSRRLINISERLTVPLTRDLVQAVHSMLRIALFEHTSLFYGRHADSILICCMYGCAKAAKYPRANTPLMFREIVGAYRAMKISDTGAPPDEALWRAIPVAFSGPPGDPALEVTKHDDLVRFYNEVFLKEIKPAMLTVVRDAGLLARADVGAGAPPPGSPAATGAARAPGRAAEPPAQRAPFAVLLSASPRRVTVPAGGGGGVMVSPMRPDRAAELRASVAAPRALYAFVGDSTTALTSPSHDLDRFNDAIRTAAQRSGEGGAAGGDEAEAPPSGGRDRRRALTRQELPPPSRRRISEQL